MIEDDGWITIYPKLPEPIERELHAAYDSILDEEIPEDLKRLLDDLD
jgi:hypothetical protein